METVQEEQQAEIEELERQLTKHTQRMEVDWADKAKTLKARGKTSSRPAAETQDEITGQVQTFVSWQKGLKTKQDDRLDHMATMLEHFVAETRRRTGDR